MLCQSIAFPPQALVIIEEEEGHYWGDGEDHAERNDDLQRLKGPGIADELRTALSALQAGEMIHLGET